MEKKSVADLMKPKEKIILTREELNKMFGVRPYGGRKSKIDIPLFTGKPKGLEKKTGKFLITFN
jgi:hypothetical protein